MGDGFKIPDRVLVAGLGRERHRRRETAGPERHAGDRDGRERGGAS